MEPNRELNIKNREYRSLATLEPKDGDFIVEGYATKWEPYVLWEDSEGPVYERIDKNAFVNADMRDVIMQYDHQGKVFARLSNSTLQLKIDDVGLFIRADLSKSTASRELYEEIKAGLITKMSWAFTIKEYAWDDENEYSRSPRLKKFSMYLLLAYLLMMIPK